MLADMIILGLLGAAMVFCLRYFLTPSLNKEKLSIEKIPSSGISYNREKLLGSGAYGTVYEGEYKLGEKKIRVAVKKVQLANVEQENRGEDTLRKLNLDHANVIKLFDSSDDKDFRYYALELCKASLDQLYLNDGDVKKYIGPMPSIQDMLLQLAKGLEYIHGKGLAHRDVKPSNVLIFDCQADDNKDKQVVVLKWADFGLSKQTTDGGSYSITSGVKGTDKWFAPEQLKSIYGYNSNHGIEDQPVQGSILGRGTNKSDIFSEGLVFSYIILGGQHPYNSDSDVIEGNPINLKNVLFEYKWVIVLILDGMLKKEPDARLNAKQVVERLENYSSRWNRMKAKLETDPETRRKETAKFIQHKIKSGSFKPIAQGQQPNIYSLSVHEGVTTNSGLPFFHFACNNLSRYYFHQNQTINHKVIMLIGADKRSKSRFINGMVNYLFGVQFQDDYRLQLIDENSGLPHNGVRRVDPWRETIVYAIQHQDGIMMVPYSITIIDTPTYGETRRSLKDEEITLLINKLFQTKIFEIDAICYVAPSGGKPLTTTQRHIIDSIPNLFKDNVKNNIRLLVPSTDTFDPPDSPVVSQRHSRLLFSSSPTTKSNSFFDLSNTSNQDGNKNGNHELIWDSEQSNYEDFFKLLESMQRTIIKPSPKLTNKVSDAEKKFKEIESKLDAIINQTTVTQWDYVAETTKLKTLIRNWNCIAIQLESMTVGKNNKLNHPANYLIMMRDALAVDVRQIKNVHRERCLKLIKDLLASQYSFS